MKPCAPAPSAAITVARSCVAESTTIGTPGIVELEIGEKIESARARQREIEQHERDVGLVVEHVASPRPRSRAASTSMSGVELRQELRERIEDQRVIVDHENLHALLPV